ncbi:MAG: VCBS repeat-containing protein [Deltaproteobacteria bacterium]|nr:VCBS repeat-containing protein [Deltaproteobacteria bacterium]
MINNKTFNIAILVLVILTICVSCGGSQVSSTSNQQGQGGADPAQAGEMLVLSGSIQMPTNASGTSFLKYSKDNDTATAETTGVKGKVSTLEGEVLGEFETDNAGAYTLSVAADKVNATEGKTLKVEGENGITSYQKVKTDSESEEEGIDLGEANIDTTLAVQSISEEFAANEEQLNCLYKIYKNMWQSSEENTGKLNESISLIKQALSDYLSAGSSEQAAAGQSPANLLSAMISGQSTGQVKYLLSESDFDEAIRANQTLNKILSKLVKNDSADSDEDNLCENIEAGSLETNVVVAPLLESETAEELEEAYGDDDAIEIHAKMINKCASSNSCDEVQNNSSAINNLMKEIANDKTSLYDNNGEVDDKAIEGIMEVTKACKADDIKAANDCAKSKLEEVVTDGWVKVIEKIQEKTEPETTEKKEESSTNSNAKNNKEEKEAVKENKIQICHIPPGNPENAHTIEIAESALDAHLEHGDYTGSCEQDKDNEENNDEVVQIIEEPVIIPVVDFFNECGQGNLLLNGDFEAVDARKGLVHKISLNALFKPSQWDVFDALPDYTDGTGVSWQTVDGTSGIEVQYNNTVAPAHSGKLYVELDSHNNSLNGANTNSGMTQTTYLNGGSYKLDFYYRPRTTKAGDNTIQVYFDGLLVKTVDGANNSQWGLNSIIVNNIVKGEHTVTFQAAGTQNSYGGFLDDISLSCHAENAAYCGDGIKNASEECDGTSGIDTAKNQTCSASCTIVQGPYCGDKVKNGTEQCDSTSGIDTAKNQTCAASCMIIQGPYCGDKIKNGSEQCDSTSGIDQAKNQTCSASCTIVQGPYCGDKIKNGQEQCDGTSGIDTAKNQTCSASCTIIQGPYCGDKIKNGQEQCDSTSGIDTTKNQTCSASCMIIQGPYCGDKIKNGSEQCDGKSGIDKTKYQTCSASCTIVQAPYCGDKVKNGSEQCDGTSGIDTAKNQTCAASCTIIQGPYCGDKFKNGSEQCDSTSGLDKAKNQTCSASCTIIQGPYCGDGKKDGTEECDGSTPDGSSCSATCTISQDFTEIWNYTFGYIWGGFYRMIPGPSAAIGDMRPDLSGLEIATGNEEYRPLGANGPKGRWFMFKADGAVEFWKDTNNDEAHSSVNLFDVTGDGLYEMLGGTTSGNQVQVLTGKGNFHWKYNVMGHSISTPAVALMYDGGSPKVFDGAFDGRVRSIDGLTGKLDWTFYTSQRIWSSSAVDDLDGDGYKEIVIANDGNGYTDSLLYCLDAETGKLNWKQKLGKAVRASSALADVDKDGILEVLIGDVTGKFRAFSGDTGELEWSFTTGGDITSSAAVGDLDGDGSLEIVFGSKDGRVYALNGNGLLVWSYDIKSAVHSSPALANRGHGGRLDVYVTTMSGKLAIINGKTGNLISSFSVGYAIVSSPVVADVDGDKKLEVFFQDRRGDSFGNKGDIFHAIRDLKSNVEPYAREWPMFMSNAAHTGVYMGTSIAYSNNEQAPKPMPEKDPAPDGGPLPAGFCGPDSLPTPISYYSFNKNVITDDMSENHGIGYGGVSVLEDAGHDGAAASFNGIDQYVDMGKDPIHNGLKVITVTAWIKPESLTAKHIIASNFSHGVKKWQFRIVEDKLSVIVSPDSVKEESLTGKISLIPDAWNHVAMIWDGKVVKLYVNGVAEQETLVLKSMHGALGHLLVGDMSLDGVSSYEPFDGLIDDLTIYEEVFSLDQMMTDMDEYKSCE